MQLAAGVVGGTLFSPLPWKLADDSAIWSQNWSWRPSPQRGPITKKPSICLLCDGGCGIQARLVSGKNAILLEGNPAHPVNQGGICPVGAAGLQFLYADYRIKEPMKQTKKRGDVSGFQPVSWDEALSELGGKLTKLRSDGKPQGMACITGQRQSSMDDLLGQFCTAYGSPNFFRMPAHADSLRLASALTTGQEAPLAFALENASFVLSFGANLIEGWGTSGRMQTVYGNWHDEASGKGAIKLVQLESRCSMTAAKASRWVAISPGSEAVVALAIAHVLIKENLYDSAFVGASVFGFDDWTDSRGKARQGFKNLVLSAYAPEQVAGQSGMEPALIRELAREFAGQNNSVAVWGANHGESANNIYHDLSFLALNMLKGNLKPGGMISLTPTVPLGALPAVQPDAVARHGLDQKRLDLAQPNSAAPFPGNGLYPFLRALAGAGSAYSIDLLLVHEANPAYSLAENRIFQAAVQKVGYLASFSSYMDETAQQADLLLPNHTPFERYDDVVGLVGAPYGYYAVAAPILPPRLKTKHTGDVILALAKNLGESAATAFPWKSYEDYLKERVKGLAASGKGAVADKEGIDLSKLRAGQAPGVNYDSADNLWKKLTGGACWYDAPVDMLQGMKTGSGKFELACRSLQEKGLPAGDDRAYLPHFAPLTPSGAENEYPLVLVSYPMLAITNGYLANPPFMTKTLWDFLLKENDLFVELNPQTALPLLLGEGSRAVLKTMQGEAAVRVHLSPGARPGVIYVVQGMGHKAYDQYIRDKGVNANDLIEVQLDPVTGLGTVWNTRARLSRA